MGLIELKFVIMGKDSVHQKQSLLPRDITLQNCPISQTLSISVVMGFGERL